MSYPENTEEFCTEILARYDMGHLSYNDIREAIERLKRMQALTIARQQNAANSLSARDKEIAELKGLLKWSRSEADYAHCDETTLARIDEILKQTEKP